MAIMPLMSVERFPICFYDSVLVSKRRINPSRIPSMNAVKPKAIEK